MTVGAVVEPLGPRCLNIIWSRTLTGSRELSQILHSECPNYLLVQQLKVLIREMVATLCNMVAMTSPGLWRARTVSFSSYPQDLIPRGYSKMFAQERILVSIILFAKLVSERDELPGREPAPFCYTNRGRHWIPPKEAKAVVWGLEQNMPTKLKKQKTIQMES